MNSREKVLSGVIAFLVIVWGAWTLWDSIGSAYAGRKLQLQSLKREYRDANRTRLASSLAAAQLEKWQTISLPVDDRQARKVYLQWLRHELDEADFDDVDIRPSDQGRPNNAYKRLRFIVSGRGTLGTRKGFSGA